MWALLLLVGLGTLWFLAVPGVVVGVVVLRRRGPRAATLAMAATFVLALLLGVVV